MELNQLEQLEKIDKSFTLDETIKGEMLRWTAYGVPIDVCCTDKSFGLNTLLIWHVMTISASYAK